MIIRTYNYLLHPTNVQKSVLDFLLQQGRKLYNAALEQRIVTYRETGNGVTYVQQCAYFRDMRRANPDTLGQLNAAQNILALAFKSAWTGQSGANVAGYSVRSLRTSPI